MTPAELKQALYNHCLAYVEQRIQTAQSAMQAAQDSANEESKSSAGDKYETGRAMAQIERDRHAQQLAEALKLKQELAAIDPAKANASVVPGSLVVTDRGTFFIAISLGKVVIDQTDYFIVSLLSPIGLALRNHRAGDEILFNRQPYQLKECL